MALQLAAVAQPHTGAHPVAAVARRLTEAPQVAAAVAAPTAEVVVAAGAAVPIVAAAEAVAVAAAVAAVAVVVADKKKHTN